MILLPDCYDNIIEIQTWNFKLTDEYNENLIGLFRDFFPLQNGCANRDIKGWVLTPVNMEMKGSDRSKDNLFASTFTTGSSALFIFILYLRFFSLFFFSFIFSSLTDLSIFLNCFFLEDSCFHNGIESANQTQDQRPIRRHKE